MLMSLAQWLQAQGPEFGFLRVFQYLTFRALMAALTALLVGLAAGTADGYVAAAVRLAGDVGRLRDLRAELRGRVAASPLRDATRLARELEHPSDKPEIFTDASGKATPVAQLNNDGVTGKYRSSEGKEGDAVWGTRGRWVNLIGKIKERNHHMKRV